jgi:hypothetical protein
MMLASVSNATSSIHRITERHTRPTMLCRWPGCGAMPCVEPSASAAVGSDPAAGEGLGPVRRHARRRTAAKLHTDRAGSRRQDDPFVGVLPEARVTAPAVDSLLEVAHDGKAEGRQPRRHVVDQVEQALHQVAQALVHRCVQRTVAKGPVAADKFGHPVQHRAGRAEAQRRQHHEPEEDAEDVAVRRQQRMLDHVAQQLGAGQFARVEVAPLGEQAARLVLVATVQGIADVGVVVAELAKAQREVEHADDRWPAPAARCTRARARRSAVSSAGQQHGDTPDHPGVVRLARVEVAPGPRDPGLQAVVDPVVARQRLELFEQQREEDGEEAHGPR